MTVILRPATAARKLRELADELERTHEAKEDHFKAMRPALHILRHLGKKVQSVKVGTLGPHNTISSWRNVKPANLEAIPEQDCRVMFLDREGRCLSSITVRRALVGLRHRSHVRRAPREQVSR